MKSPRFKVGDVLQVAARPGTTFTITGLLRLSDYNEYTVLWASGEPDRLHSEIVDEKCRKLSKLERALK